MFQSFDDFSNPTLGVARIAELRQEMKKRGLDIFIVPRTDEYQGEYVAPYAERLAWLTGFTGSAGTAIITQRRAVLIVDGRYTLQAAQQVDKDTFEILKFPENSLNGWLRKNTKKGKTVGFDPRLTTILSAKIIAKTVAEASARIKPQNTNPIDTIWRDQPARPLSDTRPHPMKYAGMKSAEKLAAIATALSRAGEDATLLTDPISVAWAFNIRGGDIPHTPITLATAIVHKKSKAELFIDPKKLTPLSEKHLKPLAHIRAPEDLADRLANLGKTKSTIRLDPNVCPSWFADILTKKGAKISDGRDLCLMPRAIKNSVEISGARLAHLRDGVAVSRFLCWLDAEVTKSGLTEIEAAEKLEEMRAETGALKELSFDTISGAGPHGAIIHYRVTRTTNKRLKAGELYLVDSGAQYLEGTTDITRTVAIGRPSREMCERFTLVLKGHIALARARFPNGTRGVDLDILAREHLWRAGLDYDHGTGHGVGSYLAVHEGPQNISSRGMTPLKPGMIISNEPGYYKPGAYGIRIENLVLTKDAEEVKGGERKMLCFETLTLAPIDTALIDKDLLDRDEISWLDDYHKGVRKALSPELKGGDLKWLKSATAPLK